MHELYPGVQFRASRRWAAKFAQRNNLVLRRPTNSKAKSVMDRVPTVKDWHGQLERYLRTPVLDAPFDNIFGRVVPAKRFNMDQSPLSLDSKGKVTYEARGADTVGIASRAGDDKRMATLTVMVRLANGVPQSFPSIIFKGKGLRISQEEKSQTMLRAPSVFVQFQPKAWTDSDTLLAYADKFRSWLDANDPDPTGVNLLFLDNLGSQVKQEFRDYLTSRNIVPWFFKPNTTDMVQPVDRHLAEQLKSIMRARLEDKLVEDELFANKWFGQDETLPAWKVRVEIAALLEDSWKDLCAGKDFAKLGLQTGCGMPFYQHLGEFEPIKIDGVAGYSFPRLEDKAVEPVVQDLIGEDANEENEDQDEDSCGESEEDAEDECDDGEEAMGGAEGSMALVTLSPLAEVESEDELGFDNAIWAEDKMDDTNLLAPLRDPPTGFNVLSVCPEATQLTSYKLHRRKLLWYSDHRADGSEGWLQCEGAQGLPSIHQLAQGATIRVTFNRRLDTMAPASLTSLKSCQALCINQENYGRTWYLVAH